MAAARGGKRSLADLVRGLEEALENSKRPDAGDTGGTTTLPEGGRRGARGEQGGDGKGFVKSSTAIFLLRGTVESTASAAGIQEGISKAVG